MSSANPPEVQGKLGSRIAIIAIGSGMFMQFIDSTALFTAVPTLARDFDASLVDVRLVLTTYLITQALLLPASGWMADRFGARRIFMIAMTVFLLGSLLAGLSQTLPQMVGARIIQGVGGAMMAPVGRIIVVGSTPRNQLIQAMMWLSLPALVGPVLGPPLAGVILSVGTWPWIFLINLPIGLIALFFVAREVPKIDRPHPGKFDGLGFGYSAICIGAVMVLVEATGRDTLMQLVAAVIAVAAGAAFLAHAKRRRRAGGVPVLDLSILRYHTYRSAITAGSLVRIGFGGAPYLLALMLQNGLGWSPLRTGFVTVAAAVGALGSRPFGPQLVKRLGFRRILLMSGAAVAVLGAAPALFSQATPVPLMVGILLVTGYARVLQFSSANALSYADLPDDKISAASTFSAVVQQITMSLGITLAGLVLELSHSSHSGSLRLLDFSVAFAAISVTALLALPIYARLAANAGANVSGQRLMDETA